MADAVESLHVDLDAPYYTRMADGRYVATDEKFLMALVAVARAAQDIPLPECQDLGCTKHAVYTLLREALSYVE